MLTLEAGNEQALAIAVTGFRVRTAETERGPQVPLDVLRGAVGTRGADIEAECEGPVGFREDGICSSDFGVRC